MMLFIDPGPVVITMPAGVFTGAIANGTSITVTGSIVPFITGGLPPYTHDWTDNLANVFVQASTSASARFQATGTDVLHSGQAILRLNEAGGRITTASAAFVITQGTP